MTATSRPRRRVLVIAGHDSSGGAGVDADREAIEAFGGEARCVVTCWTQQSSGRVEQIEAVDPQEIWRAADALVEIGIDAVKLGLLPGPDVIRSAAKWCRAMRRSRPDVPIVVDPVLRASGGEAFLDPEAVAVLREELCATDVCLTPNLPEAETLLGLRPGALARSEKGEPDETRPEARLAAARELIRRGARACLLKGGHGAEDPVLDLVMETGGETSWHTHERIQGGNLHGSGCRYSSAVAAGLALGGSLATAAGEAGRFVQERIQRAAADG